MSHETTYLVFRKEGDHHALEDARWVKRAYEYLPGDMLSHEHDEAEI